LEPREAVRSRDAGEAYHSVEAGLGIPKFAIESQATTRPAAIGIFVSTVKDPPCERSFVILPRLRRGGYGVAHGRG
jgi:hypothetical protein